MRADAGVHAATMDPVDLAYLDPPYNQHRYFTNYHVWETLVRWDAPAHYGVACKRVDARDEGGRSPFNSRRTMPDALASLVAGVRARVVAVSISNEGFVPIDDLVTMAAARGGDVRVLAFDSRRHVGSRIGVYNGRGEKVGTAGPSTNVEYVVLAGPAADLEAAVAGVGVRHGWGLAAG